jgi:hypothetical protein
MPHFLTQVTADDWEGIYIDGFRRYQAEMIPAHVWSRFLEQEEYVVTCVVADEAWFREIGYLPPNLGDVLVAGRDAETVYE